MQREQKQNKKTLKIMELREELYRKIKAQLELIGINGADELFIFDNKTDAEVINRAIEHVDLWNHNVEFIEQETAWERPAVFIEFQPIKLECNCYGG